MITLLTIWISAKYKYDLGFGIVLIATLLLDLVIIKELLAIYSCGCS